MQGKVVKSYKDIGRVGHVFLTLESYVDGEEEPVPITYRVRGLSPLETRMIIDIANLVKIPEPPMKKRPRMPLDGTPPTVENITVEEFADVNDATYKQELELYQLEGALAQQRAIMYRMMVAIQGFDLTDEEIKEELDEDAHPREPIEKLVLRLDQLCAIIMPGFDSNHYRSLGEKINELSGVRAERINFT